MDIPTPSPVPLIHALKASGCDKCVEVASSLEAALPNDQKARLSFRNLGLDPIEVSKISDVLAHLPTESITWIRSLSFSYNEGLGDEGIIALVEVLPPGLEEFGLVGCRISDVGGNVLLEWVQRTTHLAMMCIEGNHFSEGMKWKFRQLAAQRPGLLLVV